MTVGGLLLDLEGVLYEGEVPLPGSDDALARLRSMALGMGFLTNTTTRPRRAIVARLAGMGFEVAAREVLSPAAAAARLLERDGVRRIHLAAPAELAEDFAAFEDTDSAPEAVVVGDLYRAFDWDRLNQMFHFVRAGARLVALHRNRFCRREGEIGLDVGPFVAALEYAARVEAEVVGKPAPAFFALALDSLGLAASRTIMVGDDLDADIGGAQAAGIRAVQVRTGKYTPRDSQRDDIVADAVIDSITDLPDLIERMQDAEPT